MFTPMRNENSTRYRARLDDETRRYGDRPAGEFHMLFQRIIQNTIHVIITGAAKVRSLWTTLLSSFFV